MLSPTDGEMEVDMICNSFRMRTFDTGANHELVLPNGKVVLVDPYFLECDFDPADVTGADYIILTHGHFDHDSHVGYFVEKFNAKVFCGAMVAEHIMKFHKVPFDNLFPVFPGSCFTMDDMKLEFCQAKHNESGKRTWDPDKDVSKTKFGIEGHQICDMWGSMESLDWMITTNNGFRIMMVSGRPVFNDTFIRCREKSPNVLLRQAGIRTPENSGQQVSVDEMARLLIRYRAQVIVPFHMDFLEKKIGMEAAMSYFEEVAKRVSELDPGALFVYPEKNRWYSIGISVEKD